MYAVTGRLLNIDLNHGSVRTETLPERYYQDFLGGYGLGVSLLMERMDPRCDPLGPDNILGFASGYLTGTKAYIASRYMVFGKSPSTGGWGDANSGGYFGKKLKQAGFDLLLFSGASAVPVYLLIDQGRGSLQPAAELWGKDCYAAEDALKGIHGRDCEVACIGPAGENCSVIAGISTDKGRFAARSGLGAVMGSKKLKAVVIRGDLPIAIADPDKMKSLRKQYLPTFKEDFPTELGRYGTAVFYQEALHFGDAPVRNWAGSMEDLPDPKTVDEKAVLKYQLKRYACTDCPVGCGGHMQIDTGLYKTEQPLHKIEYETMAMFGCNLLNNDLESMIKINDLCNRYGMDTIGCGGLCAFAVECFEKGLIDRKQTGGLELSWGNSSVIVTLVDRIGRAEGVGALLAQGFERTIEAWGEKTRPYAIAVRNEALPGHDPRWSIGFALSYYSDPTPARHTQGTTADPVAGYEQPEFENDQATGRAKYHHDNVNLIHMMNAAGLCLFGYYILDYHALPEFLNAADGKTWSLKELERIGYRIAVLRHLFNQRAGIRFQDYPFPTRVLGDPPLERGPNQGVRIDLETMVGEYLEQSGFDLQSGEPTAETLESLNLSRYFRAH